MASDERSFAAVDQEAASSSHHHHHVTKQVRTISSQTQKLAKTPIDADFLGLKQFLGLKFRWGRINFFFAGDAEPLLVIIITRFRFMKINLVKVNAVWQLSTAFAAPWGRTVVHAIDGVACANQ